MSVRLTPQTLAVLNALAANPTSEFWGYELTKITGLPSGTLYPILARLEATGWLVSDWADEAPAAGRPRRRYYRLTGVGVVGVAEAVASTALERHAPRTRPRPALGT